ncbi:MAG TPA: hypothetical protein VNG29_02280 [Candidatus Paceibacterota bacterium]|nr:hypothetical protein [Candidatus Paceibacterota bacterium]
MTDNKLFAFNAFLVAGLVVLGILLRQSNSGGAPIAPASPNTPAAQGNGAVSAGAPAISTQKATAAAQPIRRRSDDSGYAENE